MNTYAVLLWAFAALLQWLDAPPENYYNAGNRWYQAQQYRQAEQAFRRALACRNWRWQAAARYNAGNAAFRQGDYARAVADYEAVIAANPKDEDAWHNLQLARKNLLRRQADAGNPAANKPKTPLPGLQTPGPPNPAAESGQDRMLREAQEREQALSRYFAPQRQAASPIEQNGDIFSLPPAELARRLHQRGQEGYPFRTDWLLDKPPQSEEIDW